MKLVKDTDQLQKKNIKFRMKKPRRLLEQLFSGLEKIQNEKVCYQRPKE